MNNIFKLRLNSIRKERKMTMEMLSEKAGISKPMISMYENGKKMPSIQTLERLANCLEVSTDFLIGNTTDFNNDKEEDLKLKEFLKKYEKMSDEQKDKVMKMLEIFSDN